MGAVRPPTSDFVDAIQDSRRWAGFEARPDDIVISTPPKCGTTWTQGIFSSLLFPDGNRPDEERTALSPWIDARFLPVAEVHEHLDKQSHRRFIKTHSPADAIPVFEDCTYVVVYRDGRDALMSWANHRRAMRQDLIDVMNSTAAEEGIAPLAPWDGADMDALFDEWEVICSPVSHLASWWPLRDEPFVYFLHYNDLTADLEGEMRRLAAHLDIDVPDDLWPAVVARCGLTEMRDHARGIGRIDFVFDGGADSFFHKGTNGRWEGVLTDEQLARYDRLVAEGLPPEAAAWLESGSLAGGSRPRDI